MFDSDQIVSAFPYLPENYSDHMEMFLPYYKNPVPISVKRTHPLAKMPTKGEIDKEDTIRLHHLYGVAAFIANVGYDIYAVPDEDWKNPNHHDSAFFELLPGCSKTFSTGIKVATPPQYGFLLRDRSGMGVKDVTHTAGVIEGTYRGEWKIHLVNLTHQPRLITLKKAIIQAVLTFIIPSVVEEVEELPGTKRGEGGFGSSGR